MESSFKYKPLNLDKDEIRLISITPDWRSPDLVGHLFHVPLNEAPRYEALSYAWRDLKGTDIPAEAGMPLLDRIVAGVQFIFNQKPLPSHTSLSSDQISIDGQCFKLAPNLARCIRRLRTWAGSLIIWIDAICIDQSNIPERNEQVQKMRLIYRGAQKVRIWLGEEYDDSGLALRFAKKVSDESTKLALRKLIQDPASVQGLVALGRLFSRPYWKRVWVVQEIICAKDIIVHCGPDSISWSDLSTASTQLNNNHYFLALVFHTSLGRVGDLVRGGPAGLKLGTGLSANGEFARNNLFELLLTHEIKLSTDPKDRIYALVGISTAQNDPNFVLDYSRSTREVYTSTVEYLLKTTSSLNIICCSKPGSKIDGLPTWVPDWTIAGPPIGLSVRNRGRIRADGNQSAKAEISVDGRVLVARGFRIDTIQHVGHTHKFSSKQPLESLKSFHSWRQVLMTITKDSVEAQEAFGRSLYCDTYWTSENQVNDPIEDGLVKYSIGAFGSLSKRLLPTQDTDKSLAQYVRVFSEKNGKNEEKVALAFVSSITTLMNGRRFFISNDTMIGTAGNDVLPGDVICVLYGCNFPVVLRSHGDAFLFIGEAYVDGMMLGEASKLLEDGRDGNEEFHIV